MKMNFIIMFSKGLKDSYKDNKKSNKKVIKKEEFRSKNFR